MKHLFERAQSVGELLKQKQQTVSVAESSAGGLVSAALLSVSGASAYYVGGGVIYTRDARRELLNLPEDIVNMRGANEEYALIIAKALREKLGTTWAVSEAGASGPTGNRYGDPAGHVSIAVAGPKNQTMSLQTGSNNREANMSAFALATLDFLQTVID